jgi:serine protease Do
VRSGYPILAGIFFLLAAVPGIAAETRRTALVRAVQSARDSIVNIRGQKIVTPTARGSGRDDSTKRVNGMGTGVILDSRGYIVTNFHVIDGVSTINVTLYDGRRYVAKPISHDPQTDLAIIKIDSRGKQLPTIQLGTSQDLMPGETVIAVGNAYGYQHTVTRGIISALHRTVQVSDVQYYHDLIQTDASINPGNSGGPLLNIDGELIGINVAVRVGAQGIGFALPVDKVLEISTKLLSLRRLENRSHGVLANGSDDAEKGLLVNSVEAGSPAQRAGLRAGDRIQQVKTKSIRRPIDLEMALLGQQGGRAIPLQVVRGGERMELELVLGPSETRAVAESNRNWSQLGLKLQALSASQIRDKKNRYRGGLAITAVRSGSPAHEQGIRRGDILVGMHIWETISLENVSYVLKQDRVTSEGAVKFYILRGNQTLYGHLQLAAGNRTASTRQ